jgi:PAS domain S-box-containing protein
MNGSTRHTGRNRHRARQEAGGADAQGHLDGVSPTSLPMVILDHLPELVSYFDQDMRWVWLNRAQCDFYGKTREELIGRHCYEMSWGYQSPCPQCPTITAMASGQVHDHERSTPDGRRWWLRGIPVCDSRGKVVGGVEMAVDITHIKSVEEALRTSEERYRTLVEMSPNMIGVAVDGRVAFINQAGVDMLDATSAEALLGRPLLDFVEPASHDAVEARIRQILSEGRTLPTVAEEWRTADGRNIDVVTAAAPFTGSNARAIQVVAYDVTARRRAEKALVQAEHLAALGQLAAALAHEINNPLQILRSHLELLTDFPATPEEQAEYLGVIRAEVDRLRDVARHVLEYARPSSDRVATATVEVSLQHVLALLRRPLQEAGIHVVADLEPTPPLPILPEHLTTVFLNLAVNALQAMRDTPGGQLRIVARCADGQVVVTFWNSGPAIPLHLLSRVFEPFVTTRSEGRGLGLWVSRELLHGVGTLDVSNLENDQGVQFVVSLNATAT